MDEYFYNKLLPYKYIWDCFKKDKYVPTGEDGAINTINAIYNERFNSNNVLKSGCNTCILTAFRVFNGFDEYHKEMEAKKVAPIIKAKRKRI